MNQSQNVMAYAGLGLGLGSGLGLGLKLGLGLGLEEVFVFDLGLGLGLEVRVRADYFLQLHTPFTIPRSMQRVRHQGDFQGITAATEWDPTAMMLGRWRLNPLSPL